MMAAGFMSHTEAKVLKPGVGTTIRNFNGQYAGSRKDPDFILRYNSQPLPSFAIESGWTESLPRLRSDMRLWLVGGQPEVQIVIILHWTKIADTPIQRIKGTIEVWERDSENVPHLKQNGPIFPAPPNSDIQTIPITRAQLFGPAHLLPGTNASDIWHLRVENLRHRATEAIRRMGYVPA
ncbi:hypothetical protein DTO271G3_7769 [Paecilomyces variotii]|nr:hypothetical protein DTO271G3_7769 [Paecilomyces variotii]